MHDSIGLHVYYSYYSIPEKVSKQDVKDFEIKKGSIGIAMKRKEASSQIEMTAKCM